MVKKTPALRVNSLNIDTAVTAAQTQPNLSRQLTKAHRPGQSRMVTYLSINLIDRPFSTNVSRWSHSSVLELESVGCQSISASPCRALDDVHIFHFQGIDARMSSEVQL